jgi:hypothetical protein
MRNTVFVTDFPKRIANEHRHQHFIDEFAQLGLYCGDGNRIGVFANGQLSSRATLPAKELAAKSGL